MCSFLHSEKHFSVPGFYWVNVERPGVYLREMFNSNIQLMRGNLNPSSELTKSHADWREGPLWQEESGAS